MANNGSVEREGNTNPKDGLTAGMLLRAILVIAILPGVILFGAAGTFQWPMAWIYIFLTVGSFIISRLLVWRIDPDLIRERGRMMDHEDTAAFDRVLAPLLALAGPLAIGLTAGFAVRFEWTPVFAAWQEWLGVGFYLLAAIFGTWALVTNRFFSGVVRIQKERGHHVVTSGPYSFVRHPGYSGSCVSFLGMVLMLGSPWAMIPLVLELVVLIVRTNLEDRFLHNELPGYAEYAQQTRFRLIPGIW